MLEICDVQKTFHPGTPNAQAALAGISLRLQRGEFATIIGSNGAGKSTLLGAIVGSFLVDGGSIRLAGEDITYQKEHVRARHMGRLFQDPQTGTAPGLTIEENLALVHSRATGRFPLGLALRAPDRTYFRELLAQLDMGLEDRLCSKVGLLSGGQRQALTLLTATMAQPRLLLDEHTAALDPVTAAKVLELTTEITNKNSITTLMVTHNIGAALRMGSRTIMMDKGKIVMDIAGAARESMTPSLLLQRYRETMHKELDNDRILFSESEA